MKKYYVQIRNDKDSILCESCAIIDQTNKTHECQKIIKNTFKICESTFLNRLGKGWYDNIVRLKLLSEKQQECINRELKKNSKKFSNFKFSK